MVQLDERIAERRRLVREERQQRRLRRTMTVAGLVVLALAAYGIERSPIVALQEVRVEGTQRLDPDRVREVAQLELGTSTLRLGLGEAESRLRALPLVRDVRAWRADPLTAVISIEEREPVIVARAGERAVLIDEEGVVVGRGAEAGLPVVRLGGALPAPGETVRERPGLANAHAVYVGLPGPLRTATAHYEARGARETDLILHSGARVRFGDSRRLDEKVRALGAVLEDLGDVTVSVIDVRAPASPAVSR